MEDIVEVTDSTTAEAVRLLFRHANIKAEPTGALAVAAVLERPALFAGRNSRADRSATADPGKRRVGDSGVGGSGTAGIDAVLSLGAGPFPIVGIESKILLRFPTPPPPRR